MSLQRFPRRRCCDRNGPGNLRCHRFARASLALRVWIPVISQWWHNQFLNRSEFCELRIVPTMWNSKKLTCFVMESMRRT